MPSKNFAKDYEAYGFYHVYNHCINKQAIFVDQQDYVVFRSLLERCLTKTPAHDKWGREFKTFNNIELMAYCLMSNHFHILLQVKENPSAMASFIKTLTGAYVRYFNNKYGRVGYLFRGVYKASHIIRHEHLTHISRHIHMNPKEYRIYEYSSYKNYIGLRNEP